MTRIARLLLCSTLLLSPVGSTLAAADEPLGVLVVAHGSTAAWNANVEAAVTIMRQHTPIPSGVPDGGKEPHPAGGVRRLGRGGASNEW